MEIHENRDHTQAIYFNGNNGNIEKIIPSNHYRSYGFGSIICNILSKTFPYLKTMG